MITYKVERDASVDALANKVNESKRSGWCCLGGVAVDKIGNFTWYLQSMEHPVGIDDSTEVAPADKEQSNG